MNKTIKDISLEIGSGITPLRSNELYWNSPDIPWIKTEQLGQYRIFDSMEYISDFALEDTNIRLWSPHTVSVAMYGEGKTRGNVSILMIETTTNQACCNIKVNDALADYRFLYYWLKNNYENLRALSAGVRKNLNADDIKNFPFPENSLSEQEKIADILSVVDDKIELNSKICSELEAMAKTLYDYWFVQFDFPDENGKPYRSSGGEMVWNEQLKREIPKGWNVTTINDMTHSYRGVSYDKKYLLPTAENGILVLRGNNIQNNRLVYDTNVAYVPCSLVSKEQQIRAHDIILTMSSGSKDHIGKCTMFQYDSPHTYGAFLTKFTPDSDKVGFVYLSMISDFFKKKIQAICNGTGINNLTNETFDNLLFPKPGKTILGYFEEIVAPLFEKMGECDRENEELTKLRDWLLPMLMNGQARVE